MVDLNYFQSLLILLIYVHIAATSYSIYAHRFLTHKSIKLSPGTQIVFYRLLWLLFGVFGKDGVLLHKKHHAYV